LRKQLKITREMVKDIGNQVDEMFEYKEIENDHPVNHFQIIIYLEN
jgi:hypothetical protein